MYVEPGTFWVVVVGLVIAIAIVYYALKNETEILEKKITILFNGIKEICAEEDRLFEEIRSDLHKNKAEIYNTMAGVIDNLEKSIEPKKKDKKHTNQ